jgi:hypothetical protein
MCYHKHKEEEGKKTRVKDGHANFGLLFYYEDSVRKTELGDG